MSLPSQTFDSNGQLEILDGGRTFVASTGDFVFVPRGHSLPLQEHRRARREAALHVDAGR